MADLKDQCGMLSTAENQNMNTAMNIRTGMTQQSTKPCVQEKMLLFLN